jgi:hypothetical protein
MEREGELVWAATHPFTLLDARIASDGSAAGYALPDRVRSPLVIAILGADGAVRRVDEVPRSVGAWLDASAEPWVANLLLSSRLDRFDVELRYFGGGNTWQSYSLSTGATLADGRMDLTSAEPLPVREPVLDRPQETVPELVVEPSRRISFAGFDPEAVPHRRLVDARGRIWISALRSHVVRGFDERGALQTVCTPRPGELRLHHPYDWLSVRSDGHLFGSEGGRVVEFDANGVEVAAFTSSDPAGSRWLFAPEDETPWSVRPTSVLRDVLVERGANGRWFRALGAAAVGPDGSLAVIDEPASWADDGDGTRRVQIVGVDGSVRATLPLPERCPTDALAYDGRRLLLVGTGQLWLLRTDGTCVGRARLPDPLATAREAFFAREGSELWLFAPMDAALWAFEARWR